MSPEYISLLQHWGYWLMFAAAIIEGETFLVIGGIAASTAMLYLPLVFVLALIGCMLHDGVLFVLGRQSGQRILKRKPNWQPKVERITRLLEKYDWMLIIAFRFAYGIRTIIPFALGMSRISTTKFFIFDFIGGIIWVSVFLFSGYYFGNAILVIIDTFSLKDLVRHHWIAMSIGLCIVIFMISGLLLYLRYRRRLKRRKKSIKV